MKDRIVYFDALKGFTILLMVMGHVISWNFYDKNIVIINAMSQPNIKTAGLFFQWIYSFHMPLFFMVSGFFSYKKHFCLGKMLLKRSKSYLIPYVVSGFLILGFRGYYGYWFLLSLWQMVMLSLFYSKFSDSFIGESLMKDVIVLLILCIGIEEFCLRNNLAFCGIEIVKFSKYLMPFFLGYLLRKYSWLFNNLINKRMMNIYLFLFISLFSLSLFNFDVLNVYNWSAKLSRIHLLPIVGSLTFFTIFHNGINKHLEMFFAHLGGKTLEIYILHLFFIIQIPQVGEFWLRTNTPTVITSQIIYSFICALIAIGLSVIVSAFLKQSSLCSKLLFGK